MRDILADLERWREQDEHIALATLVAVRGSAPRAPGARLCLTRSGRMAGSVSGGCVENDVFARALQVLDHGQPVVASYGIADEFAVQVGLSCGGRIDVLIEPFGASDAWHALRHALEQQRPAALAVGLTPSSLLGRKLAVVGSHATVGCIDPSLDQQVRTEARRLLVEGGTRVLTIPWSDKEATVFVEAFPPPLRLFVVGATHTAIALCRLAKGLGFHVTILDARSLYATTERFPEADEILCGTPGNTLQVATLDEYAYVVVLTHDPKFDVPALAHALRSGARYIGVMGSRGTHARRRERLQQEGFSEGALARIRAPIGLDLGARTPEEIALAILAEMLAVRSGRSGRPLSERRDPINAGRQEMT
ncbi:MAG: XdhC family protein [Candidatus Binatia bacterium]